MRKVAPSLYIMMWFTIGPPKVCVADPFPMGKLPEVEVQAPSPPTKGSQGIAEETPNQRRRRLGLPIVASYPPPDYGEALETPNQRRRQLGVPIEASFPTPDYGQAEETPNHHQKRLANAAQIADSK